MNRLLTTALLCVLSLFAACGDFDQAPLKQPGTKLTHVVPEGPCDADNVDETGNFYYPTNTDLQGAWTGTDMWDVTLFLDNGDVTRIDHVSMACTYPIGCGDQNVISHGTYKVQNALLLFDWDSAPSINSIQLPDLMYTMISCDDHVVLFESSPVSGEVDFQKD